MKNIIVFLLAGLLFLPGCKTNNTTTEYKNKPATQASLATLTQAPFKLSLTKPKSLGTDSLQSFVMAEVNGYWLIFGGRTNGFHGTGGAVRTFPARYANKQFIVYNPANGQRFAAPLPSQYQIQLSSTNMEYYQDGSILWLVGGYGCNDNSSKAPCYQTYPFLTAVDASGLVTAIVNGQTSNLSKYITTLKDNRFQVSGGALRKLGNNFYLIMGHNYDTVYVDGVTGIYTEEIRRFNLALNSGAIAVSDYKTWKNAQFHRRDLNVVEAIRANGQIGINVLAGVFQPNAQFGAPWTNPILIDQDNAGNTTYRIDTTFNQAFNAYDCGNVLLYDGYNRVMYTTLIGGITAYKLDQNGNPVPADSFLPWSKYVSTVAQYSNGTTKEFPQASPLLPGFVGASAEVILKPGIPTIAGTNEVIDYIKLPAGDNLIGWMYGGILSTAEQTNAVSNPSFAVATIYEIHIQK